MAKTNPGRPVRLTDADRRALLSQVAGLSHRDAAMQIGISKDTIKEWRRTYPNVQPLVKEADDVPLMTSQLASVYARLLYAGCPPLLATQYIAPHLSTEVIKATTKLWTADPLVKVALEEMMGGAYIDLPAEKRYQLALDKHLSELAFFLHANNFNDAVNKDMLEMFKQAREVLKAELKGSTDDSDPMQAFARFALDFAKAQVREKVEKTADSPIMPALQPPADDRIHEEMTRSRMPRSGEKVQ